MPYEGRQQGDFPVTQSREDTGAAFGLIFYMHLSVGRHGHGPVGVRLMLKFVNFY